MPRGYSSSGYGDSKTPLEAFNSKYPLLARKGLAPEQTQFHEMAKYLCETCHADDTAGAMLRLHNLMMLVENSVKWAKELTEKNGTQAKPKEKP